MGTIQLEHSLSSTFAGTTGVEMMKYLLVIGFLVVAAQALGADEMEDDMKLEPRYYLGYAYGSGNSGYGRHRRNKQPKKVGYWGGQYGDAGAELEKDIKQYLKTWTDCYRWFASPSEVTSGLRDSSKGLHGWKYSDPRVNLQVNQVRDKLWSVGKRTVYGKWCSK